LRSWQQPIQPARHGSGTQEPIRGQAASTGFADPERGLAVALAFNGTPSNDALERRVRSVLDSVYEDLGSYVYS
jgi:hypothetical protein